MGIPIFWASASLYPPWHFKICLEHFLMAVTFKKNVNPEIMLEDTKDIKSTPRPETPRNGEDANAMAARELKDKLAKDKAVLENEVRRTRGSKVGHKIYYSDVQKKLVSRLFLSLGTEGKKRFLHKNLHAEVSKTSFKEMVELAADSFQKVKCVTYERYRLFTKHRIRGVSRSTNCTSSKIGPGEI